MFFVLKNKKILLVIMVVCMLMAIMKSETYGQNNDKKDTNEKKVNKIEQKRKEYLQKVMGKKEYVFNCVNIFYKNEKVDIKTVQVLNRIYVPIEDASKVLNEKYTLAEDVINIGNRKINVSSRFWVNKKKTRINLRGEILKIDGQTYISISDLCEILNLKTSWVQKENAIKLYEAKDIKIEDIDLKYNTNVEQDGFIRLEDITAGDAYLKDENLEKFRIVGDLLKENNVPYHIAWVPRYVYPEKGVDNDLLKENNFINAEFVYTLDYLINRGAMIGLHGYTHQYGNAESVIGSEFENKSNLSLSEKRIKVEQAINTANILNIPCKFFETPHYRSNEEFQTMLEEYFRYIYEPCIGKWNENPYLSERNNKTVYIPAPLSYVKDEDVDGLIKRFYEGRKTKLISFFYHPTKEFKYINISKSEDGIVYNYGESPIKKIIKSFNKEGVKFNYINKATIAK